MSNIEGDGRGEVEVVLDVRVNWKTTATLTVSRILPAHLNLRSIWWLRCQALNRNTFSSVFTLNDYLSALYSNLSFGYISL